MLKHLRQFQATVKLTSIPLFALAGLVVPWIHSAEETNASAGIPLPMAPLELLGITKRQKEFLERASDSADFPEESELTRQAGKLVTAYESYLEKHPEDVYALILYGKFLRRVGWPREAAELFLKVDKINPALAVVKQQIGSYLAEEGRVAEAFPYLLRAIELEPDQPVYHFQLGTFLHLFAEELEKEGITPRVANDRNMQVAFGTAVRLDPDNFEYKLRHAQSFFDVGNPDWAEALRLWRELRQLARERPRAEQEYLFLCEARALAGLGRKGEARTLFDSVTSPALQATKQGLLQQLKKTTGESKSAPVAPKATEEKKKPGGCQTRAAPTPTSPHRSPT